MLNTKEIFQKFTVEKITEDVAAEIEENLKAFFEILLDWQDKKVGGDDLQ